MNDIVSPTSIAELCEAVCSAPQVLAVGAQTKPRLSAAAAKRISTTQLRGILEYDPGEFTFTALAGTTLREISEALTERGQYLPFDPLLLESGATLGGTVAANLSGPGRFRFGGVRDFILGIRFVDGDGRLLRMGGKVVKNAAGFDLPKFFVGSLGRFGVLAEMTFKVFPRPASSLTLVLEPKDFSEAGKIVLEAGIARWEIDALDLLPEGKILMCLTGPAEALEKIGREILSRWPGKFLTEAEAKSAWSDLSEFRWAFASGALIKVAITPGVLPGLRQTLKNFGDGDARWHVSAGGNVAFISLANMALAISLSEKLRELKLSGVLLRGDGDLWLGVRTENEISRAVKRALDPQNRFPSLI